MDPMVNGKICSFTPVGKTFQKVTDLDLHLHPKTPAQVQFHATLHLGFATGDIVYPDSTNASIIVQHLFFPLSCRNVSLVYFFQLSND